MKSYLSYFKLKIITGLQYKASAIAGVMTQLFFGFVYISVYVAFYESGSTKSLPMPLDELVSYLWLCQGFFSLINLWYKDKEIINLIKTGNLAYELCRPQDLYFMWACKILGERLSNVLLRFLPVILVGVILPKPYTLDLTISSTRFTLFIIIFILSTILMTFLILLYHIICMFTLDEKGIVNIFMVISDILSGLVIPLPFFPNYLIKISNLLPFRYITEFPFRFYVGNISVSEGINGIIIQIIWIFILLIIGRILTKKALNKAVIQGG